MLHGKHVARYVITNPPWLHSSWISWTVHFPLWCLWPAAYNSKHRYNLHDRCHHWKLSCEKWNDSGTINNMTFLKSFSEIGFTSYKFKLNMIYSQKWPWKYQVQIQNLNNPFTFLEILFWKELFYLFERPWCLGHHSLLFPGTLAKRSSQDLNQCPYGIPAFSGSSLLHCATTLAPMWITFNPSIFKIAFLIELNIRVLILCHTMLSCCLWCWYSLSECQFESQLSFSWSAPH